MTRRGLLLAALFTRRHGMVRLAGGKFNMGSDEQSLLRQFPNAGPGFKSMLLAETPRVEITISAFWIDRCEVTNSQYRSFVRARPEWRKGRTGGNYLAQWTGDQFPPGQADFPVTFVSWYAAAAYAEWARKRLPAEAEWEFAARAGRDAKYPWGDEEPNPRLANYRESDHHSPVGVGSYPPNPYGLFDLAGNVWEFCQDEWRPSYVASPQADRRVIRGGSYDGYALNMRVTARDSHPPDKPVAFVGFRCARSA
jgi:formylglycine-generating enzyme required for sulfatase activity